MRFVIDYQGALSESRSRGIGRYSRAFVRAFIQARPDCEFVILVNAMLPDALANTLADLGDLVSRDWIVVWSAESPVTSIDPENRTRRLFAAEMWEAVVAAARPDVLVVTSMLEGVGDNAVTRIPRQRDYLVSAVFFDLIPLIFNQTYLSDPARRAFYRRKLEQVRACDFLLAISQSSADEARTILKFPGNRLANVGASVDPGFGSGPAAPLPERLGIDRPYLLYVSAGDLRKNHEALVLAFSKLPPETRDVHQLVLGGDIKPERAAELYNHARDLELADGAVLITGPLTETELASLYREAKATIFASLHEGFGLPILEAMAFGKAVICSNRSSMPEVIGDDEAQFDPLDPDDMTRAIGRILDDEAFRQSLEARAAGQLAKFSWAATAEKAHAFLEQAIVEMPAPRWSHLDPVAGLIERIRSSPDLQMLSTEVMGRHIAKTFRPDQRRQLLLDISELAQRDARTGIQRVTRSVMLQLLRDPPDGWLVEPVRFDPASNGYFYARSYVDGFLGLEQPWHSDDPVEVWNGDVFCALDLHHGALLSQAAMLQDWRKHGVRVFTVVYDLLPLRFPNFFPEGLEDLHGRWVRALAAMDGAICISQAVADDLDAWLDEHDARMNPDFRSLWFHLGGDLDGSAPTTGLPADAGAVFETLRLRPTILMVGTIEPRKGYGQALAAFDALWQSGSNVNLVLVGKQGWAMEDLARKIRNHPELHKRLFWLEGVSDEYLDATYTASSVLLAASEGEGFGLPLIEAAQKKIPLIARDIPVFREVAGKAAFYFADKKDPEVIAAAVREWLDRRARGDLPDIESLSWQTWHKSARQLFDCMVEN